MVTFKFKKETEKERQHTNVYHDGKYIGYYLEANVHEIRGNLCWIFCSNNYDIIQGLYAETEKEMKQAIIDQLDK